MTQRQQPGELGTGEFQAGQLRTLTGLELLGTAIVVLDACGSTRFINSAAGVLFDVSPRIVVGQKFDGLFLDGAVIRALVTQAKQGELGEKGLRQDLTLTRSGHAPMTVHCLATAADPTLGALMLEIHEVDQRLKLEREERLQDTARANRELLRTMAHEIKNPLGGIRGAAQLLEHELPSKALREYTQVIIKESDRLQTLVDRLLEPHRRPQQLEQVNIHEVCERVRSVLLHEFPQGLNFVRDYDVSIPEFGADKSQLIQVVMNLARNAAQAMKGKGEIRLRTRVARQIVIARVRHRLALELHVIDNGPGIPADLVHRMFLPLVSGREGGSGLGLSLALTYVEQHGGVIECESRPGLTDFRVLVPLL